MDIDKSIAEFLSAYRNSDIMEAVIDTSVDRTAAKGSYTTVPYLNLYALNVFAGRNVKEALRKVAETADWGFWEDITEEQGTSDCEISLSHLYPHWPEDLDEGDRKVIHILTALKEILSAQTLFLFHHIDAWPPLDIRTGLAVDIS